MKTNFNRRDFLKMMGLGVVSFTINPLPLQANGLPNIIVVGGGFAGSTCAKYLKLWGGDSINVTLVESNPNYVSPILSNLVLNNQKTLNDLTFDYLKHTSTYNISVVTKTVTSVDSVGKTIQLSDNSLLEFDYLVLAPGIDFEDISGLDSTKVPHAWIAGEQTTLLQSQLESMEDGDSFIITIPKSPYRCPPGPYERACVIADYLKNTKGYVNAKVIVLDQNSDIIVEKDTFSGWFSNYGIEYITDVTITNINSDTKTITYDILGGSSGNVKSGKVLNVIPNQKAAKIIFDAGLNNGDWASVDPISYESTIKNGIYIIGDSQGTSQPKAGHIGNSEAKICADAILRKINGYSLYQNPKTNSACYSPISTTQASWLTAVYEYDADTKDMKLVGTNLYPAAGSPSTSNYSKMFGWSTNLFADSFL